MNIVSLIMQFLAPAIINKIAGSVGINQGLAGKAISAIVPAILAGLAGKASTSAGASDLAGALAKQDTGILGNLGKLIGGSGQKALIDNGSSVLGSLLGGSSTSALASAVGKFAGIGGDQSKSLLGMLAPVVLGSLAKEQKSAGLDAGGLASLLAGHKKQYRCSSAGRLLRPPERHRPSGFGGRQPEECCRCPSPACSRDAGAVVFGIRRRDVGRTT